MPTDPITSATHEDSWSPDESAAPEQAAAAPERTAAVEQAATVPEQAAAVEPAASPELSAAPEPSAAPEQTAAVEQAATVPEQAAAVEPAAAPELPDAPVPAAAPEQTAAAPGGRAATRSAAHRPGLPIRTSPPPAFDGASLEVARRIVELAEDKKAADIILLEIAPLTTVADYLVICSGGSERQLDAIADAIVEGLKKDGVRIIGREGAADSHWVLLDAGAVVIHVFAPPEREYYGLEKLWTEARTVLRVQ